MSGPRPAPSHAPEKNPPPARGRWKKTLLRWNPRYRQLKRIVASHTLSRAPAKFLQFIVIETLEGRAEQLSESVIAEKVFHQHDFVASEKSVVRVEKRRLKEKLREYYENGGRDDPIVITLGTSFVPVFSPRLRQPQTVARRFPVIWILAAALLIAAVALLAGVFRKTAEELALTDLTYDAGLTTDPAISPDGKLLAYASDRSGQGNLDIWVQNIGVVIGWSRDRSSILFAFGGARSFAGSRDCVISINT